MNNLFTQAHHNADPDTSALAEEKITTSGKRTKQCDDVYEALKNHNGSTSAELAYIMGIDRHIPARRLPDLREQGKVRHCKIAYCLVTRALCCPTCDYAVKRQCGRTRNKSIVWYVR